MVAFNTARGAQPRANWSKGQARLKDAERVCALLRGQAGAGLKVVICHHPLMEVTGGPMTGLVWGGAEASRILAEGGVDLILTGHVHMPFAHALPFGDERTYNVGASTLSLRERGCPAGFNLIEADEGEIRVTALGWTGSGFEPQRTWGFDRRSAGAHSSALPREGGDPSSPHKRLSLLEPMGPRLRGDKR
jgi:3',5'-cyclic AMP phosphodiesterase CpdA